MINIASPSNGGAAEADRRRKFLADLKAMPPGTMRVVRRDEVPTMRLLYYHLPRLGRYTCRNDGDYITFIHLPPLPNGKSNN